jgi:hypothetical protein
VPFNSTPQLCLGIFHLEHLAAEADRARFSIRPHFDVDHVAAEKNPHSNRPRLRMLWAFPDFPELPFDPVAISHRKAAGFRVGTPARHGHPRSAVRPQTQHIPPCAPVPNQQQRNLLRPDGQRLLAWFSPFRLQKEFKLHAGIK